MALRKKLPGCMQNPTHLKMTHFHLKNDSFAQDRFLQTLIYWQVLVNNKTERKRSKDPDASHITSGTDLRPPN